MQKTIRATENPALRRSKRHAPVAAQIKRVRIFSFEEPKTEKEPIDLAKLNMEVAFANVKIATYYNNRLKTVASSRQLQAAKEMLRIAMQLEQATGFPCTTKTPRKKDKTVV